MKHKTLTSVLEALSDGRCVKQSDVASRVLDCKIWVSGAGSPGCLYDSGPNYSASRAHAISDLLFIADTGDEDAPRGMATALRYAGSFYHKGWVYEVSQDTLRSVLA